MRSGGDACHGSEIAPIDIEYGNRARLHIRGKEKFIRRIHCQPQRIVVAGLAGAVRAQAKRISAAVAAFTLNGTTLCAM